MVNQDIRIALMLKGFKQWHLARALNISEASLTRKLRTELPEEEKARILSIIDNMKEGLG